MNNCSKQTSLIIRMIYNIHTVYMSDYRTSTELRLIYVHTVMFADSVLNCKRRRSELRKMKADNHFYYFFGNLVTYLTLLR